MNVSITSYGVLHGQAPRPTTGNPIRVDLTTALRNPASDPRMIDMTGLDPKVSQHVLNTPGADLILRDAVEDITQVLRTTPTVEVLTFCKGGRHRSVAIAEEIAATLRAKDIPCEVTHRDVRKPVLR